MSRFINTHQAIPSKRVPNLSMQPIWYSIIKQTQKYVYHISNTVSHSLNIPNTNYGPIIIPQNIMH